MLWPISTFLEINVQKPLQLFTLVLLAVTLEITLLVLYFLRIRKQKIIKEFYGISKKESSPLRLIPIRKFGSQDFRIQI